MENLSEINQSVSGEKEVTTQSSPEDIIMLMDKAREIQPYWQGLSFNERAAFLKKINRTLISRIDEIAATISTHNGKTRVDAMASELIPSIMALSYYLKKSKKWLKDKRLGLGNIFFINKQSKIHRVPYGVIGIITPWNYPFTIPFSEVVMGLLAGNCVILKTAHELPEVGKILKEVFDSAGFPEGVFSYVECDGPTTSTTMLKNGIDKLFFTGSVGVGKLLMKQAAENLTPINLELGGNDAMIVCEDANLNRAAAGAVWAGFQNAGQSCGGVERVYVHEAVYDKFIDLISEKTRKLRVGIDKNFNIDIGSMTTDRQVKTVESHISDALAKGAVITAESNNIGVNINSRLVSPKVLTNVNHDMLVMKEETFGPVIGVMKYSDTEKAIALANDSDLGLTASVWSSDRKNAEQIAKKIKAGAITINDHLMSHGLAETPWGGFKLSGLGRSHGALGFNEMTQPQVIVHDYLSFLPSNLWWFPAGKSLYQGLKGIPYLLYGQSLKQRTSGLLKILRILPRLFMNR